MNIDIRCHVRGVLALLLGIASAASVHAQNNVAACWHAISLADGEAQLALAAITPAEHSCIGSFDGDPEDEEDDCDYLLNQAVTALAAAVMHNDGGAASCAASSGTCQTAFDAFNMATDSTQSQADTAATICGMGESVQCSLAIENVTGGVNELVLAGTTALAECASAPAAPVIGPASVIGNSSTASVTFTAPALEGSSAITGYSVIRSGGGTTDCAASPCDVTGLADGSYSFTVTASNAHGTGPASAASNSVTVDTTAPLVVSVVVPTDGNHVTGANLDFSINFDEAVTVTGLPRLALTVGAATVFADYVSGSGSANLLFRHAVAAVDNDNDGIGVGALDLNGGTISDAVGNAATLLLNGLPGTAGIRVNQTYTVTPSAGADGSITPDTPQTIAQGEVASFTVLPEAGFTASVGGSCGGALTGNTYTTNAISADCSVTASFTALPPPPVTVHTGPSATGTGDISASVTGGGASCGFDLRQFIPVSGHDRSPPLGSAPPGILFPHGLFDFSLVDCTPGSTVTLSISYPSALPAGTQYWKYGPTPTNGTPHWYELPATVDGNTASFSITDGGLGDDDLLTNGDIIDQGGPGAPGTVAAPVAGPAVIPTLSEWALIGLALLSLLLAWRPLSLPVELRVRR